MLTDKELRRARRKQLIEFYDFRQGPCYTAEQVQDYIDRTYLKGTSCAAPSQQDSPPTPPSPPPHPKVLTIPSRSAGSILTDLTQPEADSSMPAGMTPELASCAVKLLAQRIGKKRKPNSLPSSFPPPPPKTGRYPALIKS